MRPLTCAAEGCTNPVEYDPLNPLKKFCSRQCGTRTRVRLLRERRRRAGGGPNGGGGRKQRRLFPRPLLTKPPKSVPVAEPTLFETDLLATLGGAVEYRGEDYPRP